MMASLEHNFQTILSSFKNRLTQKELDDFQCATLEDVRLEIARIQAEQASRKEMMNLTRIQSFLEAMDQFGNVIEVFLNSSVFVPFIWGPVKFVLQVGSS
jgi:adenine-specific DNA methylase